MGMDCMVASLVLLLAAAAVEGFLSVALPGEPASAVEHRMDEVRLNKINPLTSVHLDLFELALDPVTSPSLASSSTPVRWSSAGRSTSSIYYQAAALPRPLSSPLQHRRHWSSSEPPTGSGDVVLLPAGDVLHQIFGSPVMSRHNNLLIHFKPSHSEALPHRPHASVTPLEASAGDLLDDAVVMFFRDFDVFGSFLRDLLVTLLLLI
ncbi:unnamed protein product [Urochloa humidicola]